MDFCFLARKCAQKQPLALEELKEIHNENQFRKINYGGCDNFAYRIMKESDQMDSFGKRKMGFVNKDPRGFLEWATLTIAIKPNSKLLIISYLINHQ